MEQKINKYPSLKQVFITLLFITVYNLGISQNVTLHSSYCNKSFPITAAMITSNSNNTYGYYRYELSPNADFSGYDSNDMSMTKEFSKGQYAAFQTLSGLHIGQTYYVRIRIRETTSEAWSNAGAVCSVAFINMEQLSGTFCNKNISIYANMITGNTNYAYNYYRYELSTSSDFSGYDSNDMSMTKEFSKGQYAAFQTLSGLHIGQTYYVRIRVRETTTESWSNAGPVCSVAFINTEQLSGTFCNKNISIYANMITGNTNYAYNYYRYELSTSSDFSGYDSNDMSMTKEFSKGQYSAFQTLSGLHIGQTYYVRIRVRETTTESWSNAGPVCSVAFINTEQLSGTFCNKNISIYANMITGNTNYAYNYYRYELSTSSDFSGYDSNDMSMTKEFSKGQYSAFQTLSGLHIGQTYYVRIRVRETTTESWSNAGPVCSVTFINTEQFMAYYCGASIPITLNMVTSNNNNTYGYYRYELSPNADFSGYDSNDMSMTKEFSKGQYAAFKTLSGLHVGQTYYVRVRIRETTSDSWSNAGPVCSVTFINTEQFMAYYCGASTPITLSMTNGNNNSTFNYYRYELSPNADFSGYNSNDMSMTKEFSKGQYAAFKTLSGLHVGQTYYVRVRIRETLTEAWSNAGPVCSVTFTLSSCALSSFTVSGVHTLAPEVLWSKNYGGNSHEEVYSIISTSDGGYVFCGQNYASTTGGDVVGNHGGNDYWVVKLDGNGNVLWTKSIGGAGGDAAYSIVQDGDGGYTLVGVASPGSGDFAVSAHGSSEIGIVKLDASGNIVKVKMLGGSSLEWAYKIKKVSSGGYVIVGASTSNDGDIQGCNTGNWDAFVLKIDDLWNVQWSRCVGKTGYDMFVDVLELPSGEYFVSGGSGTTNDDYIAAKLSSSGALLWQKTYGGTLDDNVSSCIALPTGEYLLTGMAISADGDVAGSNGGQTSWTIKTDNNGNILWKKALGGSGDEGTETILGTADGGFIVAGYSTSNDFGISTNGGRDGYLAKLNASGEVEWQQTYGGIHNERIRNMAKTHDDGYIATTYLYSTDGTEVIVGRGSRETLVTKFSSSPTVACMGSTLNFTNTSSNATVYQWQVNGVSVGTTANLTYAFNTAGTYTLSLVASNASCSDTKDLVLTIKPNTLAASAGDDVSLTTGSSVTVGGSPAATGGSLPYSYAWLPSDNLNSATLANPIAHPLQTTNYILKVTDGAGCSHQDSVMVTVLAASKSYAVLTKKLDGGYYDLKGSILYFKYTGEYNTGNLTVKVYDEEHRLKSCPQLTTKQYGDNRFELDVSTCTGIIANTGYYIMEVQNEKTEKYLLKFKY